MRTGKNPYSEELAIANLRKDLKLHYPGIKFSVRANGNAIRVRWSNGPEYEDVANLIKKFTNHQFDDSWDYMDYSPTVFNKMFGGSKYVFATRD